MGEVRHIEQWYRMNKARRLDEWMDAMAVNAIPMFNTVYADREATSPTSTTRGRPSERKATTGRSTSRATRREPCGRSTCPSTACPASWTRPPASSRAAATGRRSGRRTAPNPDGASFSPTLGIETRLTNRGLRALELFGGDPSVTREEFDAYKFDVAYSSAPRPRRDGGSSSPPPPRDPLTLEALEVLKRWDLRADPGNPRAALALLTLKPDDGSSPSPVATETLQTRLREAASELKQRFGRSSTRRGGK